MYRGAIQRHAAVPDAPPIEVGYKESAARLPPLGGCIQLCERLRDDIYLHTYTSTDYNINLYYSYAVCVIRILFVNFLTKVLGAIVSDFRAAVVNPGEMCGVMAAQSIGRIVYHPCRY